jgi:glycerophosphoryl diester phosphodiesterase
MPDPPLLLGHRGARAVRSVPENSIMSFDLALEHGCSGIEFDVRLAGCGCAVVCHDSKVGRITVAKAGAKQLAHLPRLADVLRHYDDRIFLDIELKVSGLESKTLDALRERRRKTNYVISSFLPGVLLELKARSALAPLGLICKTAAQLVRWRKLPVDYVIVHHTLITRRLVQLMHRAGRKIVAWTVNDRRTMLRLAGWEVDGLISDDTKLLAETLG